MSEQAHASATLDAAPTPRRGVARLAVGIVGWATASPLRIAVSAGLSLTALATMFAAWSLAAHVAVESLTPTSIATAFAALDERRYDDARAIVGELKDQPATPELMSGALYVLGAAKSQEADEETTADRRQALYELAARYLQKAVDRDLPALRRRQALFMLGKSLVGAGEATEGIRVLEEALADPEQPALQIHRLLVNAYLDSPTPRLADALAHSQKVVADPKLPPEARASVLAQQADLLIRLKNPAQARAVIDQIPAKGPLEAHRQFLLGRIEFDEARGLEEESAERHAKLKTAIERLREAQRLDGNRGPISRQSMYWIARSYEARGEDEAAFGEFDRLGKIFGDQPEAVAATLALGDYRRRLGEFDRALEDYRAVLETVGDPQTYANPLLPLAELRARLTQAYAQLLSEGQFGEALALVEQLDGVFERTECADLRAKTLEQWGEAELAHAEGKETEKAREHRKSGRYHLRAAALAYEKLAEMRFATPEYADELWTAAECAFRGQSFSTAERLLDNYLHQEAQRWNALALLRLGQSRLALRKLERAIATLEECIELFPRDPVAYQARLECARAYQQNGNFERAEELLTSNLRGDALTPLSHEWRDSLFTLGRLLYDTQRYEEAVAKLEEAVERYPEAESTLLAKYTIARAFHGAADAPAQRVREAKTENERSKNRKLLNEYLEGALAAYIEVQRAITLKGQSNVDPLSRELLLNCYMMKGSVLYELRRFEEARQAYGNVVTLYQNQPIVLESLVQVANCWRRMNDPAKARLNLQQAKLALSRLPKNANYQASTNFDRQQWEFLIDQMSKW